MQAKKLLNLFVSNLSNKQHQPKVNRHIIEACWFQLRKFKHDICYRKNNDGAKLQVLKSNIFFNCICKRHLVVLVPT